MMLSRKTVMRVLERWAIWHGNSQGVGPVIHDIVNDYGEPGYSHSLALTDDDTPMVVLGSYWCECGKVIDTGAGPNLHSISNHYPKLFEQLESQGVQFEWYDEWEIDHENNKCYRSSPDSYSWTPSYVHDDNGELLTPDDDMNVWLEWAVKEPTSRALVIHSAKDLEDAGWSLYQDRYENGWHPGQDDNPTDILNEIKGKGTFGPANLVDVVFRVSDKGQFDMTFEAWVKGPDNEGMLIGY